MVPTVALQGAVRPREKAGHLRERRRPAGSSPSPATCHALRCPVLHTARDSAVVQEDDESTGLLSRCNFSCRCKFGMGNWQGEKRRNRRETGRGGGQAEVRSTGLQKPTPPTYPTRCTDSETAGRGRRSQGTDVDQRASIVFMFSLFVPVVAQVRLHDAISGQGDVQHP